MKASKLLTVPAIVMIVFALISTSLAAEKQAFRIKGAALLCGVVEKLASDFFGSHPDCPMVITGATTGKGFKAFLKKEADVVMASRAMTEQELGSAKTNGILPKDRYIGKICVAVITNASNPVTELTMEQLRKIFVGEITSWKDVGGPDEAIKITTRAVPETGTGLLFQKVVLKGGDYAPGHQVMRTYKTTVAVCAKSMAIGYIPASSGYFDPKKNTAIKVIPLKTTPDSPAMKPDLGVAKQTNYPVTIPFYLYWDAKIPSQCPEAFAEFAQNK